VFVGFNAQQLPLFARNAFGKETGSSAEIKKDSIIRCMVFYECSQKVIVVFCKRHHVEVVFAGIIEVLHVTCCYLSVLQYKNYRSGVAEDFNEGFILMKRGAEYL